MRRRRWVRPAIAVMAVAVGGVVGVRALVEHSGSTLPPECLVGRPATGYLLDPEQAADAATIAAVARREGLPDHAVTVALAAALQESKLRNLAYGDRDSLGVFQQRPSQGWGSPVDLVKPAFAARAFFRHLEQVPGWQTLPVAEAAQAVQHSADGSAYGVWETQARALARALTGEQPGGLSCRFAHPTAPRPAALTRAADSEMGGGALAGDGSVAQDWAVAEWLVAHAYDYGVVSVTVRGQTWTSRTGAWRPDPRAAPSSAPTYVLAPRPKPS